MFSKDDSKGFSLTAGGTLDSRTEIVRGEKLEKNNKKDDIIARTNFL
jgi:hypothetical protein